MEKTKAGVTVGLFGGALYFLGFAGLTPLILAAIYVFMAEENKWLRKTAVKAVAVVLAFTVLSNIISLASDSTAFLNNLVLLFRGSVNLVQLNRIISMANIALSFLRTVCLLLFGLSALKMSDIPIGPLDKAIDG